MEKKKHITQNTAGCPEHEAVCAYFDGEMDKTSPEYAHIAACAVCQDKLKDFAIMAEAIARDIPKDMPPEFPETILKKVRARIDAENNPVIPFYMIQLMKAAAIFILITGIFIYIKSSSDVKPQITGIEPVRSSPSATISAAIPTEKPSKESNIPGEIQLRDMRDVSTSPDIKFLNLMTQKDDIYGIPAAIPGSVTHVWTTDNMSSALEKAKECLLKSGVKADKIKFATDGSGTSGLSLETTKKQLSTFVRLFAQDGFGLLSPAQPQPEQNVFYGTADDPVGYEMKIVSSGR